MTKLTGYEKGGFVYKILNLYNLTCRPPKKSLPEYPERLGVIGGEYRNIYMHLLFQRSKLIGTMLSH